MTVPEGFSVISPLANQKFFSPSPWLWMIEGESDRRSLRIPTSCRGESGRDRILIFEDQDGDGKLETRKLFAEGHNLVAV